MSRTSETFGKKEIRNKQLKKRKDKAQRKLERKEQGKSSFDDMLAWVDENGRICSEPPEKDSKQEIKAENIDVSVPKGGYKKEDVIYTGKIQNYDQRKGFGFISSLQLKNTIFFHITDCSEELKIGEKVTFETQNGLKGLKAYNISKKG